MWAPSESSQAKPLHPVFHFRYRNPFFIYWAVFLFLLPLFFLVLIDFFGPAKLFFSLQLFFWGSLLELTFDLILEWTQRNKKLTLKNFLLLHYLNRSIIGLPFSIYLLLGQPFFLLGIFRFWGGIFLLWRVRQLSLLVWHGFFFLGGCLFYIFFQNYGWPAFQENLYLGVSLLGFWGLLFARKQLLLHLKKQALAERRALLFERRLQRLERRETEMLESVLGKKDAEHFQNTNLLAEQNCSGLLLGIRFLGMKQIWSAARSKAPVSERKKTLSHLQHEWELQRDQIYKSIFEISKAQGLSFVPSLARLGEETLFFFWEFCGTFSEGTSKEKEAAFSKRLFQIYEELQRLWENLERGRKGILASGRDTWKFAFALSQGEVLVQRFCGELPLPVFQGEMPEDLHGALGAVEHPCILLDAACTALLRDFFRGFDSIGGQGWAVPLDPI